MLSNVVTRHYKQGPDAQSLNVSLTCAWKVFKCVECREVHVVGITVKGAPLLDYPLPARVHLDSLCARRQERKNLVINGKARVLKH